MKEMVTLGSVFFTLFFVRYLVSCRDVDDANGNFYGCLSYETGNQVPYNIVHTVWSSKSYQSILESSIHNARFNNSNVPKPYYIIVPENKEQVRAAMICCKNYGFETRIRSGGHDYEGLSYISYKPYCLVDLFSLRKIDIDVQEKSAWVEAGATLGELYYSIANKSNTLAFPAGTCPSVVEVPPVVTLFTVARTHEEGATKLVRKWQNLVKEFPEELFVRININPKKDSLGKPSIQASFNSLYLGRRRHLRRLMRRKFPELNLKSRDCEEMSWINSTIRIDSYRKDSRMEDLLERKDKRLTFYKTKSDYVKKPLSEKALEGLWNVFKSTGDGLVILTPHGGKMSEILEDAIPFPHRKGVLYNVQYFALWHHPNQTVEKIKFDWVNGVYDYMAKFVSKPRTAYLNTRDLDLGTTQNGNEKYSEAKSWGQMYFNANFEKLARVKYSVDPANYFRNEQSIPPLGP
ncbi:hypothetical protein HAX54_039497 [Datura stramonium]|uniref:FAD-binding PCMH-type domain-containing protein n=1 Tax=Datura stramonium TaxID=4076 RepID=A0ABS8VMQ7_DATST|nr:hypothetical protein [Datura stramonium]